MAARFRGVKVSGAWDTVLTEAARQGVRFQLNSGKRTLADQWRLVREKGVWSPSNKTGAARPTPWAPHIRVGSPAHAIDVQTGGEDALQRWLLRNGVQAVNNVPGEPWHLDAPRTQLVALAQKIKRRR